MRKNKLYEQILLIRLFEEKLGELFTKGGLFGTIHSCIGQEAVAVGIVNVINKNDIVVSNHRGHGHFIAFTSEVEGLMAELMGKATGVCGGRGGSQHLCKGNFYSNGITGGMVAVATGMAFAEKLKKSKSIVVCFFGDGALGQGIIYESFNMSSLWNLPIIYILENNYYAMSTHISCTIAGSMIDRGRAFGIEVKEITTNDVEIIYSTFKEIVKYVRSRSRPFLLIINTYRLCGHSKSDDCSYRSRKEEEEWRKKDPLLILGKRLEEDTKKKIYEKCKKRIELALEKAKKAEFPNPDDIEGIR